MFGAALATGLSTLAACGSGEPTVEAPQTEHHSEDSQASNEVVMRLIAYKPAQLAVAPGTTVTWKQQDAGVHTVTSGTVEKGASAKTEPDGTFDSGEIAKGEEFTYTFEEAGKFEYFCEVHPATMTGTVTVD